MLDCIDDKRYIQERTTDTLPWGHYSINNKIVINNDIIVID